MKEETRYFVEEYRQEQEWKERWKANHIEFDNYFKYSGEVEPYSEDYQAFLKQLDDNANFIRYYKKRLKDKDFFLFLNEVESKIVDYFYRHPDKTMLEVAEDVGHSKTYVSKIISKHINIQQNDKKNTG